MQHKASQLLPEKIFWEIIDTSLLNSKNLEEQNKKIFSALEKLSVDELIGFKFLLIKFEVMAYTPELWAAAYLVKNGCSDDGFEYFRYWLISRGEAVFKKAMENPDSLADEYNKVDGAFDYEYEGLAYLPIEVLEEKYDIDYYEINGTYDFENVYDYPDIHLEWHIDTIKELLPKTVEMLNR